MRRKYAYEVLSKVLIKNEHAHLVLKDLNVPKQDQAWISALVYTTLQNNLYLTHQFEDLMKKTPTPEVLVLLKMAAAQLYKMRDIPEYAVVNETVALAKEVGLKYQAGMINAVLKKMIQRGEREILETGLKKISIETSMPLWILNLISKQYSEAYAIEYAHYCQKVKPTYVWINHLKVKDEDVDPSFLLSQDPMIADPSLFRSDLLKEHAVVVQDINSQKVVDALPIKEHVRVLDACCAPGTKTLRLANRMNNTGEIIAIDLVWPRVQVTQESLIKAHATNVHVHQADATNVALDGDFDVVLIDAPCSGLGVLSHKHDLRYHIKPEDLDSLQNVQKEMLEHLCRYVKIEGVLAYATCTLNRKENNRQVEAFLKRHPEFTLVEEQILDPIATKGDGFYYAIMKKQES